MKIRKEDLIKLIQESIAEMHLEQADLGEEVHNEEEGADLEEIGTGTWHGARSGASATARVGGGGGSQGLPTPPPGKEKEYIQDPQNKKWYLRGGGFGQLLAKKEREASVGAPVDDSWSARFFSQPAARNPGTVRTNNEARKLIAKLVKEELQRMKLSQTAKNNSVEEAVRKLVREAIASKKK